MLLLLATSRLLTITFCGYIFLTTNLSEARTIQLSGTSYTDLFENNTINTNDLCQEIPFLKESKLDLQGKISVVTRLSS